MGLSCLLGLILGCTRALGLQGHRELGLVVCEVGKYFTSSVAARSSENAPAVGDYLTCGFVPLPTTHWDSRKCYRLFNFQQGGKLRHVRI